MAEKGVSVGQTLGLLRASTAANANVTASCTVSALIIIRRRSKRSASTPPIGAPIPCVANAATPMRPVAVAFPVRWATSTPTVIDCIHVPTSDTTAAVQKVAKER